MTTYRFYGPTRRAVREGVCPVCGKKGKRQATIEHTVNPFNRNADGAPKSWAEVAEDVTAEAREWESHPFIHARCES